MLWANGNRGSVAHPWSDGISDSVFRGANGIRAGVAPYFDGISG